MITTALCYLNGSYLPVHEAKVSVLDRGFIFGDGVYEVLPVYSGRFFQFQRHMERLTRSLKAIQMDNPLTPEEWQKRAAYLCDQHRPTLSQGVNQIVYLQVTRGVAARDHVMPKDLEPTVFMMVNAMKPPSDQDRQCGVACITADDFRWQKAHIKSISLLGSVLARQMSFEADATETVMFRNGYLSEGASSNVWVVKDRKVIGPQKNELVLQGIRYDLIEQLCQKLGLIFELRPISQSEVFVADELLLSSATKEVLAITLLDGKKIGNGVPGPVYQMLYQAYQKEIESA